MELYTATETLLAELAAKVRPWELGKAPWTDSRCCAAAEFSIIGSAARSHKLPYFASGSYALSATQHSALSTSQAQKHNASIFIVIKFTRSDSLGFAALSNRICNHPAEEVAMSAPDLLFAVRNNYYLGAYQHAISEASDLESLDDADKLERDIFVYRSYIELGSYEVQPYHPLQVPRSRVSHMRQRPD